MDESPSSASLGARFSETKFRLRLFLTSFLCFFSLLLSCSSVSSGPDRIVKLLLTADFHFHKPWFEWVLHVAGRYDMICIAGDLLDMFHADGVVPQLIYAYEWMQMLMKLQVPVALCSGNHDLPGNQPILVPGVSIRKDKLPILGEFAKHRRWLHALKMNHLVAVDDDSKIFRSRTGESLTVVCLPYAADGHVDPLDPAARPCLILHHEPPTQTLIAETKSG